MEADSVAFKSIEELEHSWNKFATTYQMHDSAMQTFYYTLIHMIDLPKAQHILEVACGTGRLLPLSMNLKPLASTYTALDLSSVMIDLAHKNIQKYLNKMGV
jgi:ubiquinone/menaquinone biosynthesis C-methylase UbiE